VSETWGADDLTLTEHLVREVELLDGLYAAPTSRGGNVEVPARHGTVWRRKRAGEGSFVLNLWVAGATASGSIPGGGTARVAYERNLDVLLRTLKPYHRLVRFWRTLEDGSTRECYGEVVARIDPAHLNRAVGRVAVEVAVPGAFWQDAADVDQQLPVAASGSVLRFTAFAAATAPMATLKVRTVGRIDNPVLTATDSGEWWRYDGAVAAGSDIEVDSATWSVSRQPTAYAGLASVRFSGGYMLELPPDPLGPRITVTGTNLDAGTAVRLIGRRRYHL
jgi:hypothetical protein